MFLNLSEVNQHLNSGLVKVTGLHPNSKKVLFHCKDGAVIQMYHFQDFSEDVYLEKFENIEVNCNWCNLVETIDTDILEDETEVQWTHYKVETDKGNGYMCWYGETDAYYPINVDFIYEGKEVN